MVLTTISPAALLAHDGGWDEILLVAGPIALFGGLLWLANKRAKDRLGERLGDAPQVESSD
ncbi:MAG: hypothetical protein GY929_06855 [Actinomycetia bacterium]|nr:hypothetical protein [Actinomycetes bacterium]